MTVKEFLEDTGKLDREIIPEGIIFHNYENKDLLGVTIPLKPIKKCTPLDWVPKFGERYWLVDISNTVVSYKTEGITADVNVVKHNRIFQTKEECEFYKKVNDRLKEESRPFKPNELNYFFYYNHETKRLLTIKNVYHQYGGGYFSTQKKYVIL